MVRCKTIMRPTPCHKDNINTKSVFAFGRLRFNFSRSLLRPGVTLAHALAPAARIHLAVPETVLLDSARAHIYP